MVRTKTRGILVVLLACVMTFALCLGLSFAPKHALAAGEIPLRVGTLDFTKSEATTSRTFLQLNDGTDTGVYYTRDGGNLSVDASLGLQVYNNASTNKATVLVFYVNNSVKLNYTLKTASGKTPKTINSQIEELDAAVYAEAIAGSQLKSGHEIFTYGTTYVHKFPDIELAKNNADFTSETVQLEKGYYILRLLAGSGGAYLHDLTVTAAEVMHTVSFNTNGGTPTTIESVQVAAGKTVSEPAPAPTKAGSVFHGWHIASDVDGSDTGTHYDFTLPVEKDLKLIAIFYETAGKTAITSFDDFANSESNDETERLWQTTVTVDYTGQSRTAVRNLALAQLPSQVTGKTADGSSVTVNVKWAHESVTDDDVLDEVDPIVGTHYYVASLTLPEDHYTVLWLRAKVEVKDVRETVTKVNSELNFTVAAGANLDNALPTEVNVDTDKNSGINVKVTWDWNPEDVVASKSPLEVYGTPEVKYSLGESVTLKATVTIIAGTSKSEVVEDGIAVWDARNQEKAITEYTTDGDGNYIVMKQNGVEVIAQNTVQTGTVNAGGHAIQIIGPGDKSGRTISWIKIVVPFNARLSVRAGADGSGSRTFHFTTSSDGYDKDVIKTQTHSIGATTAFSDDKGVVTVDVKAGTYYFWNATNQNSAQVYEIKIDKLSMREDYTFTTGTKLPTAEEMPEIEDYTFVGWVNASGTIETGETATSDGNYSPLYAKAVLTGSVRLGNNGGIRYRFTLDFINGEAFTNAEQVTVKLALKEEDQDLYTKDNAEFSYENGVFVSSIVVVGWNESNAAAWRERPLTASIEINFGSYIFSLTADRSYTAKEIAEAAAQADESIRDQLQLYLG